MDFIRGFNTSALTVVVFMIIIVGGVVVGKILRERKDAKDLSEK
jgi:hypothetical protein